MFAPVIRGVRTCLNSGMPILRAYAWLFSITAVLAGLNLLIRSQITKYIFILGTRADTKTNNNS